jgi:hypothetical protein
MGEGTTHSKVVVVVVVVALAYELLLVLHIPRIFALSLSLFSDLR